MNHIKIITTLLLFICCFSTSFSQETETTKHKEFVEPEWMKALSRPLPGREQPQAINYFELPSDANIAKNQLDSLFDISKNYYFLQRIDNRKALLSVVNEHINNHPQEVYWYSIKKEIFSFNSESSKELYDEISLIIANKPSYDFYFLRATLVYDNLTWSSSQNKDIISKSLKDWEYVFSKSVDQRKRENEILARTYYLLDQYDKALIYYTKLITENSYSRQSSLAYDLSSRARCYTELDSIDLAINDLDKAIEIAKIHLNDGFGEKNSSSYCSFKGNRYELLIDKGEWEKVEPLLSDLDCAGYSVGYWKLAYAIYRLNGNLDQALGYIEDALSYGDKMSQSNYGFYTLRASIHFKMENYQNVLKDIDIAEKVDSEYFLSDYYYLLLKAEAKFNLKDYLGALRDIKIILETNPSNAEAYLLKGRCLYLLNDNYGTMKALTKVIELEPENGYAHRLRGLAKHYSKDKSGACQDWSLAGELGEYKAYEHIKEWCN